MQRKKHCKLDYHAPLRGVQGSWTTAQIEHHGQSQSLRLSPKGLKVKKKIDNMTSSGTEPERRSRIRAQHWRRRL